MRRARCAASGYARWRKASYRNDVYRGSCGLRHGKTHPVTGPGPVDALALEKINNFQARATLRHAGRVVATTERTLSDSGTILTIRYLQPDGDRPIDNVSVYEKQVTTIER